MKAVTDSDQLSGLVIACYKSINGCDLEISCQEVLIVANSAGKFNFTHF